MTAEQNSEMVVTVGVIALEFRPAHNREADSELVEVQYRDSVMYATA